MQLLTGGIQATPQIVGQRCGSLPDGTEAALLETAQGIDCRLILQVEGDRTVDLSQSEGFEFSADCFGRKSFVETRTMESSDTRVPAT
jgi:hypothetical protein